MVVKVSSLGKFCSKEAYGANSHAEHQAGGQASKVGQEKNANRLSSRSGEKE